MPWDKAIYRWQKFRSEEDGTLTVFAVVTFVTMISLAGIAVDLARIEADRTRAQIALDNAALAASSLNAAIDLQTGLPLSPTQIANRHMEKANLPKGFSYDVISELNTANKREINLSGHFTTNTIFMHFYGHDEITSTTRAASIEEKGLPMEISLVLDVSGSMVGEGKLDSLVSAAKGFITTVLASNTQADPHFASVNLVPYSTYVNVGEDLYTAFGGDPDDNESTLDAGVNEGVCVEINDNAFYSTSPPSSWQTEAHLTFGYYNETDPKYASTGKPVNTPFCPAFDWAEVMPVSKDEIELHARLDSFLPVYNTSIDDGTYWGAVLLDPATQPVVQTLAGATYSTSRQKIDTGFIDLPRAYGDANKILVIMTDGYNTDQYDLKDSYQSTNMTNYYWNSSTESVSYKKRKSDPWQQLSWRDYFSIMPLYTHSQNTGWSIWNYLKVRNDHYQKNTRLSNICYQAKAQGIQVYTITYEASSYAAGIMSLCASPNKAYTATQNEIGSIFANIALSVKKLQLTQ